MAKTVYIMATVTTIFEFSTKFYINKLDFNPPIANSSKNHIFDQKYDF